MPMVLSAVLLLLFLLLHFFSMILDLSIMIETSDNGFKGASTVVVMVVASMVVIVSNARRTSPMRVKLGMVNVCVIINNKLC